MPGSLSFPFLTIGVIAPLIAAAMVLRLANRDRARLIAALSLVLSIVAFGFASREVVAGPLLDPWMPFLESDPLDRLPHLAYALMTLLAVLMSPRQDTSGKWLAGVLLLCSATETCYAAADVITLGLGWWITLIPFLAGMFGQFERQLLPKLFFVISAIALTIGLILLHSTHLADLKGASTLAFAMLLIAIVFRKGVFPFHAGTVAHFQHGPLLPAALLFNGHLGALLLSRSEEAVLPVGDHEAISVLGIVALFSAVLLAVRTFAERQPRRMIALITLSQASFILAGLTMETPTALVGALIHWLVVGVTSVGLCAIVRCLEVRVLEVRDPQGHLGLAMKAPRFAAFFLLFALPLIGLPGTLGYCGEDLLFHGALERHVIMGLALPIATAFNAINLMRLYGLLFLGMLPKHVPDVPDAIPRERWPLAFVALALILTGLMPKLVLSFAAPPTPGGHSVETTPATSG